MNRALNVDRRSSHRGLGGDRRTGRWVAIAWFATVSLVLVAVAPSAQAESFRHGSRRSTVASSTTSGGAVSVQGASKPAAPSAAVTMLGAPRSGLPWHSGFYTGLGMTTQRMSVFEKWAGRPSDIMTVYPAYDTWSEMADSGWVTDLAAGFKGHLAYGLPLLPKNRVGQWADVTDGSHDYVFRTIAQQLVAAGRGDTPIRVGLEANGDWFAWGASYATAAQFKAAFQRVVTVMRSVAPKLSFWFDTSSCFPLRGQVSRLDGLTVLYPGDAYVDGISMDHYDSAYFPARTLTQFNASLQPSNGPGLADAAAFARAHGKPFAVPEWGLRASSVDGGVGDNPVFMEGMYRFFQANKDILVYEAYFSESDPYIANALYSPTQMPTSASTYLKLW